MLPKIARNVLKTIQFGAIFLDGVCYNAG